MYFTRFLFPLVLMCSFFSISDLSWAATGQVALRQVPKEGVAFNGITTYAMVDDGPSFDFDTFTLAVWVKHRQITGSQIYFNRGEAGQLFTLYLLDGKVRMLVEYEEGKYTHAHVDAPKPNTWVHYVGTYDGREIKLYVDGRLVHTEKAVGRMPSSQAKLFLGALQPDSRVLDGWLDDLCVWNRVLSAKEIGRFASNPDDATVRQGLIARWARASLDGNKWKNMVSQSFAARYYIDPEPIVCKADGYRGIWYSNQRQNDEYVYKYSGGLGTYCAKHRPFAVYAKEANKTFFCYGGTQGKNETLLHMVSYYDHATGMVPRPTILLDKHTIDAHDNPVMAIDDKGYIWIFSSSHGTARPSYISVSKQPYNIDAFERVLTTNFSYTQPYYLKGQGFLFLHTKYNKGRCLFQMSSANGRQWTEPRLMAKIELGHYEVSWCQGNKVGTAFNYHPEPKGLNWRTNLYYMETVDFGKTWRNATGQVLEMPLTTRENAALVFDYRSKKKNVYMKDLAFDAEGHPIILYLTSGGWESGPVNAPRTWTTARWTGKQWTIRPAMTSDNNYDTGSLYIESPSMWRIIGPTQPGPQRYNTGGEVALWTSSDLGKTWALKKQLTQKSSFNHTYCRKPLGAHPDFYAMWADGHGRRISESRLYFTDKEGTHVWRLPEKMEAEFARPEIAW